MKKCLSKRSLILLRTGALLCLLLSPTIVFAQRIRFSDTGNKWTQVYFDNAGGATFSNISNSWYARDTIVATRLYHQLYTKIHSSSDLSLAVREDTLGNKVYFRFTSGTDTLEHLMYDYNLLVGDTLKIDNSGHKYPILHLDSVQMNGRYYKRWEIRPFPPFGTPTYIIEGIGTNWYPMYVVYPTGFEQAFQLRCFTNRGLQPRCTPATPIFYTSVTPFFAPEPVPVDSFDNDSSCVIRYLPPAGVSTMNGTIAPMVLPNPGGAGAMLVTPASMRDYELTVYDYTGRVLVMERRADATPFPIGRILSSPGLYCYVLQLPDRQKLHGQFSFQ